MASSIVAESAARPNLMKGGTWFSDYFVGLPADLIAAGLITADHLAPQPGRPPGHTVFTPDGLPCPPRAKRWREPGFCSVRQLESGEYRVDITVTKEVQKSRREVERAARHEAEQECINKAIAEEGHRYQNWQLRQVVDRDSECWEGTKSQLQAAGLGVGLAFPGEPGAPEELNCTCPLGFKFRVCLPGSYAAAKAAAGIYTARSWLLDRPDPVPQFVPHAPGVLRREWTVDSWQVSFLDVYRGTAEALIAAGLVPAMKFFPGQPGANKSQASYRQDWNTATSANHQKVIATIRKRGRFEYEVETPADPTEAAKRKALRDAKDAENKERERALAGERSRLRRAAASPVTSETVRKEWISDGEFILDMLWNHLSKTEDGWRFALPKNSDEYADLTDAFRTILDLMKTASPTRDKKYDEAVKGQLRLAAARQDAGLQSMLRDASHLHLVQRPPEST